MKAWLLQAGTLVFMVAGMAGGFWVGSQAEAWLDAHPGPCLIGEQSECDAYGHQASLLPIFMGLVGALLVGGVWVVGASMSKPTPATEVKGGDR